jgi:Fe-Mn family superoxide dismutase
MGITRREALGALALGGGAALAAGALVGAVGPAAAAAAGKSGKSSGKPATAAPGGAGSAAAGTPGAGAAAALASLGKHAPVPLPFDPKKLRGLSDRLLVSHWENNYGGAVKNLNKVEEQLAAVNKDTPGFLVAGLKERELSFTNSVILHELYFGNLGGSGKPAGTVAGALGDAFGSFARFEELLRATGGSLGGGSGWAVLAMELPSSALRVYWAGNHTQAVAFGAPLLVLDMYEHAYALDYGAAAAKYIDAFFENLHWEEIDRRYARALEAAKALRA